jgi:hypothetical protein
MQKKKVWKIVAIILGILWGVPLLEVIVIGLVSLFSTIGNSPTFGPHILRILITIVLMVVVLIVGRKLSRKAYMQENPVYRMQMLDKKHLFDLQISKAQNYYNSYQLHRAQNKKVKVSNDTINQAYQELYQKLDNRFDSMCNYLEHFDYIANQRADEDTILGIDKELYGIENLITQLNKLDTVNIQVETSLLDNDTDRIDFLIQSLEELNENQ